MNTRWIQNENNHQLGPKEEAKDESEVEQVGHDGELLGQLGGQDLCWSLWWLDGQDGQVGQVGRDGQDGQDNLDEKTNLSVESAFCQLVQTKVEPGMPSRVNLVVVIIIMVAMVAVVIIGLLSSSSSSSILISLSMFTSLGITFV